MHAVAGARGHRRLHRAGHLVRAVVHRRDRVGRRARRRHRHRLRAQVPGRHEAPLLRHRQAHRQRRRRRRRRRHRERRVAPLGHRRAARDAHHRLVVVVHRHARRGVRVVHAVAGARAHRRLHRAVRLAHVVVHRRDRVGRRARRRHRHRLRAEVPGRHARAECRPGREGSPVKIRGRASRVDGPFPRPQTTTHAVTSRYRRIRGSGRRRLSRSASSCRDREAAGSEKRQRAVCA